MMQPSLFEYERPLRREQDSGAEKNGVVYTKSWVVDLILDLVGYTVDRPLHEFLIVEPAAGDGSFLLRIVDRLAESCAHAAASLLDCRSAIVAYELDDASAERARNAIAVRLASHGLGRMDAELLADGWIRASDYLLDACGLASQADFVVGNPPYIRLEDLENGGDRYRAAYPTMAGRADIYVAFFEAALRHLKAGGVCGFICADRWMLNQYGAKLRAFVTGGYAVEAVIQMHEADAFEQEVSAYPAVTIIRRGKQGPVTVATLGPTAEDVGTAELTAELRGLWAGKDKTSTARVESWFNGPEPWPLMQPECLALLRRLEEEFPSVEQAGATVGIGVATGADKVFVTKDSDLVESDRLLPLAMASDVRSGVLVWSRHYLVNPWDRNGLVDLGAYPRLAAYFELHRCRLIGRHVGRKAPANWYRTIDRVNDELTGRPKLYLPDLKGRIAPVLDAGKTYPHHNLYFIVADDWDLSVLGGLLLSDVAQFFIEAYGVRMRGGYLRFQAQYLRRLRVPHASTISRDQEERLRRAFAMHDVAAANVVAAEIYRLTRRERELIGHPG